MAVYFPSNRAFGPFAFNADMTAAAPAPTEMYWYLNCGWYFTEAEMRESYGFFNKSGTAVDGPALDKLQATTTDADTSTATLEKDDDVDSPYKGAYRIKFTMA
jgi:hypothetical protein